METDEIPKKKKFAKEKTGNFVDEIFFVISIAGAGFLTFFLYHNNYFHPVGWYFYADVMLVGIVFTLFIYVLLQAAKAFVVISLLLCLLYFIAYYTLDLRQKFNQGNSKESTTEMEEVDNHFTQVITNIIYPQRNDSMLLSKIEKLQTELDSLKTSLAEKENKDTLSLNPDTLQIIK